MNASLHGQRMTALRLGNESRAKRADLKRRLAAGEESLPRLLAAPPYWARTMRLEQLLPCLPSFGQTKMDRACRRLNISPQRQIGLLSRTEQLRLVRYLADNHAPIWARVAEVPT